MWSEEKLNHRDGWLIWCFSSSTCSNICVTSSDSLFTINFHFSPFQRLVHVSHVVHGSAFAHLLRPLIRLSWPCIHDPGRLAWSWSGGRASAGQAHRHASFRPESSFIGYTSAWCCTQISSFPWHQDTAVWGPGSCTSHCWKLDSDKGAADVYLRFAKSTSQTTYQSSRHDRGLISASRIDSATFPISMLDSQCSSSRTQDAYNIPSEHGWPRKHIVTNNECDLHVFTKQHRKLPANWRQDGKNRNTK